MNNAIEQQISEGDPELVLLDLDDRKVALHMIRAREDRQNPSNETLQRLETALHNIPTDIKQYVIIARIAGSM